MVAIAQPTTLFGNDVSLEIETDINQFAFLCGFSTPDAAIVLFKAAHVGKSVGLDSRFGLSFGEAVPALHRRTRIVSAGGVDCIISGPGISGRILTLG